MKVLLLGDIHGAFLTAGDWYDTLLATYKYKPDLLIQVGDFGFWPRLNGTSPWDKTFRHRSLFIDGNHEDHELLRSLDLKNWGLDPYHSPPRIGNWRDMMDRWEYKSRGAIENGILFVGGASSIDRQHRMRGVDWFPEENISYADQEAVWDSIEKYGPENIHTVISHDCPGSFDVSEACKMTGKEFIDGNRKFLEAVRSEVRPERWYFGHYHCTMEGRVDETYWRCIDMIRKTGNNDHVWVELPDEEDP